MPENFLEEAVAEDSSNMVNIVRIAWKSIARKRAYFTMLLMFHENLLSQAVLQAKQTATQLLNNFLVTMVEKACMVGLLFLCCKCIGGGCGSAVGLCSICRSTARELTRIDVLIWK